MLKWIFKKIRTSWDEANHDKSDLVEMKKNYTINAAVQSADRDATLHRSKNSIRFNVYPASGGYVLEFNRYDDRNDRHDHGLYIINEDTDLAQGLSRAITIEMLKR